MAVGEAIEKAYQPTAKEAKAAGQKSGGRGKVKNFTVTYGKVSEDRHAKETIAVAAKAVGMSASTYAKAKQVVKSGNKVAIAVRRKPFP